jgi:hypothetical protein
MPQTLSEFAKTYSPETTKNISDLKEVSTNLVLEDREGTDKSGNNFKYKVIVVEGIEYRVPSSVIGNLKAILEKKPSMTKFSVARQGKTKDDTKYTVIPLD